MLGAWIGNKVNDLTTWEPTIDKINEALGRWKRIHPTMNGHRIIIQAIVGGITQFKTQVQGMPLKTELAISKIISNFIWEGHAPHITADILQRPIKEGGLNLLDIKARNKAIDLMWLKALLNFTKNRQPWAIITDLIIDVVAPTNTLKDVWKNPFLQSWNAPLKGPRVALLNSDIIRMLKTAKKYGTNLAAIRISPHLKKQLPAFYHLLAAHRTTNNRQSKCLLDKHNVNMVADLLQTSARLDQAQQENTHRNSPFCKCAPC
jgi:hypothetical protein